jgi:hypothetical protein
LGTTGNGDALSYTFSGINLNPDQAYAIVFSTTNVSGNVAQVGLKSQNSLATYEAGFTNLSSGDVSDINGADGAEYITFNGSFTAVPEPSSATLLGLGGLALYFVRRRRNSRA